MTDDLQQYPVTVALPTLGCKANRYDSDALARALIARGYRVVPEHAPADIYIVNTCTVTGGADAKSRKLVRRAAREDGALVIVTGCAASLAGETFTAISGVDAVVPLVEQDRLVEMVVRLRPPMSAVLPARTGMGDPGAPPESPITALSASAARTRATVKVQDGCNLHCAYCAVTLARGPLRSRPLEEILVELRALTAAGVPEIVLTGIRLDAYGQEWPDTRLGDLLDATRALPMPRLRLSSLEPMGITRELVAGMAAHPTLCRHFHLCLQSGDDNVLTAMRRGYTTAHFVEIIDGIRAVMPDATFTTDLIVGFPGETDAAFANTLALVEQIGFIKLHIFKFSPRPGTAAATMTPSVSEAVKDARSQALFALERQLFQRHAARMVGVEVPVLVERSGPCGDGLTPHYLRVRAPFPPGSRGKIHRVCITGIGEDCLFSMADIME